MEKEKIATRYGEIVMTREYHLFTKLEGNRDINEVHVARLMKSFARKQLIVPIIVNQEMQVIDGQHRLEACRRLRLPVYYIGIENYGLEECHILNQNMQVYRPEDFLAGYIKLGFGEYKKFQEFHEKYPFLSIHLCQIYLTGGRRLYKSDAWKTGEFKVENFMEACLWAERTLDFKDYSFSYFENRNFNSALLKLYQHPKYDHTKMMNKMQYQAGVLRHQPKEKYFIENLCDIFNYRAKDDEKIYPHEVINIYKK